MDSGVRSDFHYGLCHFVTPHSEVDLQACLLVYELDPNLYELNTELRIKAELVLHRCLMPFKRKAAFVLTMVCFEWVG